MNDMPSTAAIPRRNDVAARAELYPLHRRDVMPRLLARRGEMLVIAGLGAPAWDVTAAGDCELTFPLWGAMGGAVAIGLGLALAQPRRRILVVTGDGEFLMGLGLLATVMVHRPRNLSVAVFDNERYGETGMQVTHTAHDVDLAAMAAAAGWPLTGTVAEEAGLAAALPAILEVEGPALHVIKVRAEELPLVLPPKDGVTLKDRFRKALLGPVG
jgi:thiamine pyrophosphate-dependent acetolactate synthase large subunit-like protein